jgi:hypothetical protein
MVEFNKKVKALEVDAKVVLDNCIASLRFVVSTSFDYYFGLSYNNGVQVCQHRPRIDKTHR